MEIYYVQLVKEKLIQDLRSNTLTLESSSLCIGLYTDLEMAITAAREIKIVKDPGQTIYKFIYKLPLNTMINYDNPNDLISDEFFIKRVLDDESNSNSQINR